MRIRTNDIRTMVRKALRRNPTEVLSALADIIEEEVPEAQVFGADRAATRAARVLNRTAKLLSKRAA